MEREREIYISPWLQVHVTGPRHHLTSSLRYRAQGICRERIIDMNFQVWSSKVRCVVWDEALRVSRPFVLVAVVSLRVRLIGGTEMEGRNGVMLGLCFPSSWHGCLSVTHRVVAIRLRGLSVSGKPCIPLQIWLGRLFPFSFRGLLRVYGLGPLHLLSNRVPRGIRIRIVCDHASGVPRRMGIRMVLVCCV